mmetsp:Transcript_43880/g.133640  ORF Transcript_43880/g.133640 Transcript_43880/m.133640 type:complete len:232 (-) Transcript_43880:1680-2375(-)
MVAIAGGVFPLPLVRGNTNRETKGTVRWRQRGTGMAGTKLGPPGPKLPRSLLERERPGLPSLQRRFSGGRSRCRPRRKKTRTTTMRVRAPPSFPVCPLTPTRPRQGGGGNGEQRLAAPLAETSICAAGHPLRPPAAAAAPPAPSSSSFCGRRRSTSWRRLRRGRRMRGFRRVFRGSPPRSSAALSAIARPICIAPWIEHTSQNYLHRRRRATTRTRRAQPRGASRWRSIAA